MSVMKDARKIQLGALIGFGVGWSIGKYLFVSSDIDTTAIYPALITAGIGVAVGGYLAINSIGGQ